MRGTIDERVGAARRGALVLFMLSVMGGPVRGGAAEPDRKFPFMPKAPITPPQQGAPPKPNEAAPPAPKPAAAKPAPPAAVAPTAPAAAPPPVEPGAPAERIIAVRGDRLTVRVTEVPLDEVVREVAAPSKADVKGAVKDPKPVTADFASVPLQDGLTRLLGEQNFLLTYRENGSLRSLTLLGGPVEEAPGAQAVKVPPAQPAAPTPTELLQRTVPVSGKLQELLGQPTATMQQLMDITLRQEDAGLRLEAMRAGMNAIDTQPDMRAAVVKSLEGMDDQALETMVRNLAPTHAQEVVSQMAATSRTPEIRARSLRVLRTLNETPGGVEE